MKFHHRRFWPLDDDSTEDLESNDDRAILKKKNSTESPYTRVPGPDPDVVEQCMVQVRFQLVTDDFTIGLLTLFVLKIDVIRTYIIVVLDDATVFKPNDCAAPVPSSAGRSNVDAAGQTTCLRVVIRRAAAAVCFGMRSRAVEPYGTRRAGIRGSYVRSRPFRVGEDPRTIVEKGKSSAPFDIIVLLSH